MNSQLDQFNLNISRGLDDQNGDIYFALICIRENNISKMSSIHSVEQLEVLKAALELLMTKNGRFKAKKIVKMMLNKHVKFPVINDIYLTIENFTEEKYFQESNGYYYALPRTLIEFNVYFRTYYNDFVKDCVLCKQICIRPVGCKHCSVSLHKICADRYHLEEDKCIGCGKQFELNESIQSDVSDDDRSETQNDEIESEDESEDEDMEVNQNGTSQI